ncbi:hypothetical protein GGR23_000948 [Gellertiella hungarica]|uniref:Uncharacterized protein n=1 Tax=Gellertiella hungarica TaxID=1572859 RepID=A0A7W6J4J3_9HYPH|nr:hypothetical protein [Gellertiella hungarica]
MSLEPRPPLFRKGGITHSVLETRPAPKTGRPPPETHGNATQHPHPGRPFGTAVIPAVAFSKRSIEIGTCPFPAGSIRSRCQTPILVRCPVALLLFPCRGREACFFAHKPSDWNPGGIQLIGPALGEKTEQSAPWRARYGGRWTAWGSCPPRLFQVAAPSRWGPFTQDHFARSTTIFAQESNEAIDSCAAFRIAGLAQKRILVESKGFKNEGMAGGRKTKKQKNVLTLP